MHRFRASIPDCAHNLCIASVPEASHSARAKRIRSGWVSRGLRFWRMFVLKFLYRVSLAAMALPLTLSAHAAQLSSDARAAIPHDLQQLVVVDYRAMQNSEAAMQLKDRVMPSDLRQFDDAVQKSGINDNHDVDSLAFILYRPSPSSEDLQTVGIAQGQFPVDDMLANFRKQKVRPSLIRTNS